MIQMIIQYLIIMRKAFASYNFEAADAIIFHILFCIGIIFCKAKDNLIETDCLLQAYVPEDFTALAGETDC